MKTADLIAFSCLMLGALPGETSAVAASATKTTGAHRVYFGTYTGQHSRGIYVAEFEPSSGTLTAPRLAAETVNPTFLATDPEHHFIYAVNEVGDFGGQNSGAVSAFKVDQKTGALSLLNQKPSGGAGPCHLVVSPKAKCVAVANYGSGSVAVLPIEADGRVDEPSAFVQHHGSSINRQRQEGPHAHFVTWDPEQTHLLTCDLGLDKVLSYKLNSSLTQFTPGDPPFFSLKAGSGPRHLAFSPDGRFGYVLNEISSTLTCCSYAPATAELREIQSISTLPEEFHGANTCAEIEIHGSGRFLYASNRGHDSIAVFARDPLTGKVTLTQHQSTKGKTPRHFALDPSGNWLLAENQDSDSVVVFAMDPKTGQLSFTGESQKVGAPVCAVFIPKL